jgi:hypothetical protein
MGVNGWHFWKTHHNERGFASMHTCHVTSGTPSLVRQFAPRTIATSSFCRCRKVIRHPLECELSHATSNERRVWLALLQRDRMGDFPWHRLT